MSHIKIKNLTIGGYIVILQHQQMHTSTIYMISLVHVSALSPSSQSLHQNVIKTYNLFVFIV
jgi:hypothetical protein